MVIPLCRRIVQPLKEDGKVTRRVVEPEAGATSHTATRVMYATTVGSVQRVAREEPKTCERENV